MILMVFGYVGRRNKNRGLTECLKLTQRACTRTADNEVCRRKAFGNIDILNYFYVVILCKVNAFFNKFFPERFAVFARCM